MAALKPRPCPVCSSVKGRRFLRRQFFEQGSLGKGYDVVICSVCGAGFADGIPKQLELDSYYSKCSRYTYDSNEGAESEFDFRRFHLTVDQLIPFIKTTSRILDIGCATGGLLSVFKAKGFFNIMGADPSADCAAAAKRLHLIDVRVATFRTLAGWNKKFDLILMLGVLEHVRDVKEAIQAVSGLLARGGLIYVAVPNVCGLVQSRNAPFQQFSMEHINFFSIASLSRLFAENSMATVKAWDWSIEWREKVTEPIASGLFKKSNAKRVQKKDRVSVVALREYINESENADNRIIERVNELVLDRQPLLIWGTGALTRRLLASTRLREANIVGFIDSSVSQQKETLLGLKILSPSMVVDRTERILVCSTAFEKEILKIIYDVLKLPNNILLLPD